MSLQGDVERMRYQDETAEQQLARWDASGYGQTGGRAADCLAWLREHVEGSSPVEGERAPMGVERMAKIMAGDYSAPPVPVVEGERLEDAASFLARYGVTKGERGYVVDGGTLLGGIDDAFRWLGQSGRISSGVVPRAAAVEDTERKCATDEVDGGEPIEARRWDGTPDGLRALAEWAGKDPDGDPAISWVTTTGAEIQDVRIGDLGLKPGALLARVGEWVVLVREEPPAVEDTDAEFDPPTSCRCDDRAGRCSIELRDAYARGLAASRGAQDTEALAAAAEQAWYREGARAGYGWDRTPHREKLRIVIAAALAAVSHGETEREEPPFVAQTIAALHDPEPFPAYGRGEVTRLLAALGVSTAAPATTNEEG